VPQIGGYSPGFNFSLGLASRDAKPLSVSGSESSVAYFDSTKTTTTGNVTVGSQWRVYVLDGLTAPHGAPPPIVITGSDPTKAIVHENGDVDYVAAGSFLVTATRAASLYYPQIVRTLSLTNTSTTSPSGTSVVYTPDALDVSKHVLVVYNQNSADSIELKNYYLANRPGMSAANVLAVATSTSESIPWLDFTSQIRDPLRTWFTSNPTKYIRYIVVMLGVPTRISDYNWMDNRWSIPYHMSRVLQEVPVPRTGSIYEGADARFYVYAYQGTTALVTHINMGTLAACKAYIDKVASKYTGNTMISAEAAGFAPDRYAFDDAGSPYPWSMNGDQARTAVLAERPAATVYYDATSHITAAPQVRGYMSWGWNGGLPPDWALNGAVTFNGDTGWYLIQTIESFNGQRSPQIDQSSFTDWFAATAFGGTNYSATPVGGVCHLEEPGLGGANGPEYFGLWERGYPFADCAWASRHTPYMMAVGDPLITK
jgi:uncharacterized protein (TIGR03790 family)